MATEGKALNELGSAIQLRGTLFSSLSLHHFSVQTSASFLGLAMDPVCSLTHKHILVEYLSFITDESQYSKII